MKKKIILIVGLPGSGKSHLIQDRFSNKEKYIVFDDVQGRAVLDCPNFCFSRHYPKIIAELKLGEKDVVISDISFCEEPKFSNTKEILRWWIGDSNLDYEIQPIFFENSPEDCLANLESNIENRSKMIHKFTIRYFPQQMVKTGDELISVYKKNTK